MPETDLPAAAPTAGAANSQVAGSLRLPPWIYLAMVPLVAHVVASATGFFAGRAKLELASTALRLLLEALPLFWAASRSGLPAQLKLSLRILAWTSVISTCWLVLELAGAPIPPSVSQTKTLLSYVTGLVGILAFPLRPLRGRRRLTFALDVLISTAGLSALLWVLGAIPLAPSAPTEPSPMVLVYGLSQVLTVAGLNVLVLRGAPIPSRRAFWWFVAAQAAYLPSLLLAQYALSGGLRSMFAAELFYFLVPILGMVAAAAIRQDPLDAVPETSGPKWMLDFNPLAFGTPAIVGCFLLLAIVRGPQAQVEPLAITLVAVTMPLLVRLFLSVQEAVRLAEAEFEADRLRHHEKMDAVGRLAGGIAHAFNNLMTTVIGYSDLSQRYLADSDAVKKDLDSIKAAGTRAAALTNQLLQFSGRQMDGRRVTDLAVAVSELEPEMRGLFAEGVALEVVASAPVHARVDPEQLRQMILEFAENANHAMAGAGHFRLVLDREVLERALESRYLGVPPGEYAVLTVSDDGRGIEETDLPKIFDPFFSTRPKSTAIGLGLAAVYGIVAAHRGGIAVESKTGRGTTIRIYLPAAGAPA